MSFTLKCGAEAHTAGNLAQVTQLWWLQISPVFSLVITFSKSNGEITLTKSSKLLRSLGLTNNEINTNLQQFFFFTNFLLFSAKWSELIV